AIMPLDYIALRMLNIISLEAIFCHIPRHFGAELFDQAYTIFLLYPHLPFALLPALKWLMTH
ncbi:hypothetical protein, partial [Escherichia coli]|uniref:hypothetical protein n=1 Tax=Escherichia coli TaxID=562 RepID=UPI001BD23C68